MAFPYKSILCPIDFDDNSIIALDSAIELARHFNSTLVLVHVVPVVLSIGGDLPPYPIYEREEKTSRVKVEDIANKKLGGLKYETHLYTGDVIASILDAQKKYQPDLMVIATHGRSGLARLFLGSVAEAVVRKAGCPVLSVREAHDDKSDVPGDLR